MLFCRWRFAFFAGNNCGKLWEYEQHINVFATYLGAQCPFVVAASMAAHGVAPMFFKTAGL